MIDENERDTDLTEFNIDDIPIDALNGVDMELPDDYQDEIFAVHLLGVITQYHTAEAERRALRHQGEHVKAETIGKMAATYRAQAALIQYEHPATKEIYRTLAANQVKETQRVRAARAS